MIDTSNPPAGVTATAAEVNLLDGALVTTSQINATRYVKWPMACFGSWQISNDGARTNGAGMVGDVTLTAQGATLAKTFDASEGAGTWGNIAVAGARAGYAVNYQLFPDAPAQTDAVAFGAALPFCEAAFLFSGAGTEGIFNAAGVLGWQYSDGVGSWAALTLSTDQTGATGTTGDYFSEQDGAISFIPPDDWASVALDGVTAYWIRAVVQAGKGANMTTVPVMTSVQHDVVTPTDGFLCPHSGTVTDIRLIDQATTLHTTNNVVFILVNFTTGAHSGAAGAGHTFAQDQRQDAWASLTLTVTAGDELGVLVTEEDTNNDDPTGVMLELGVTRI